VHIKKILLGFLALEVLLFYSFNIFHPYPSLRTDLKVNNFLLRKIKGKMVKSKDGI